MVRIIGFLIVTVFLTGCSGRDEVLYSLGGFLFIVFLLSISMTYAIKHFHNSEKIKALVLKVSGPAITLSRIIFFLSLVVIIIGSILLWNEGFYPEKLIFLLGVILLFIANYIKKWAKSPIENKGHYARLASISIGFSIAMFYIIMGAPLINP